MKVAALLEARRRNWQELELACQQFEQRSELSRRGLAATRFAALYRAACADLALATAYQLPPQTVNYLHHLVGRAHNQLYRSQGFRFAAWMWELLSAVPQRLFEDNALRVAFGLFWGLFLLSMALAYRSPTFAEAVCGRDTIAKMEEMYSEPLRDADPEQRSTMVGFYIWNNTGIGLRCFAMGLVGGIGGLLVLVANATQLGATFGQMASSPSRDNFYEFVLAHGPFELTAIVLSAAAGMRLGFSMVSTGGLTRRASLERAGRETMPVMALAMILFFLAALIEGFVSPSGLPYLAKALVASLSSCLLLAYFVILGQPGLVQFPWTPPSAAFRHGESDRPGGDRALR